MASGWDRQVELAEIAGYENTSAYQRDRAEFREEFDTSARGELLAEGVGLWSGELDWTNESLGEWISEMMELDPDFDADAFVDAVYQAG